MTPRTLIASVALMGLIGSASAGTREGIFNGGFEEGAHAHENRPAHWLIGFPDDPAPVQGEWRLVADGGSTALELTTAAVETSSQIVVQVVDLPAAEMSGKTLAARCRVRRVSDEGWIGMQVAALNPEATPDPEIGIAHVGFLQLTADSGPGWQELSGDLTLLGPAEMIVVVLFAVGDGDAEVRARFDDVSVVTELELPACGPWNAPPLAGGPPPFPVGVVNENPRNRSDRALEDLVARAAEVGDIINLFAHVRWNGLAGLPTLDGHDRVLEQGRRAAELDLARMLTFDFTHAELDGIGDVNPWPDGTPVERLDRTARAAYVDELAALVEAIRPTIVSVGIETDFFLNEHRDEWGDFRALLCEARDRLQTRDPDLHVTTYFTLETLVHPDLSPNAEGQSAMRELIPCIDSVGFSYYPADGFHHLEQIPQGMMTAAAEVAPALPLIVPEFGFRGGDEVYTEQEQEAFLRRALAELEGHPVVAAAWYSLYDQTYFGVAPFFQDAFRSIGLIRRDGAPKSSFTMLARTHHLAGPHPQRHPGPWCRSAPRTGGARVGP